MSLKTSYTIQAFDKVSAPVRKIGAGIASMARSTVAGFRSITGSGKSAAKAVGDIDAPARRSAISVRHLVDTAKRLPGALKGLEGNRGLKSLKSYAEAGGKALGFAAGKAAELAKWGGVALGAGIVALGAGVFKTGIKYENFMTQLVTSEGTIRKAGTAFNWVKKFAADTPYELDQVMEAFIKLRAYGIDPTNGTLRTLGDTASGMGKDVNQAVEALADAQTGEFERLKEFGIKAKVQGDQVRFAYTVNNKAMVVTAKNSSAAITKALLGIWDSRFAGGMARQSKNLGGILSNLADWWSNFKQQIGNAGVFDYVKGKVGGLLASLQTPAGAAKATALAKNISDGMIKALKILEKAFAKFDFGKFIADLATIVGAAASIVNALGGIGGVINALAVGAIANFGYAIGSIAVAIGAVFGVAAAPIIATVAIITAVIAALFLLWRNWGSIKAWFAASWAELTASIKVQAGKWAQAFTTLWEKAKNAFATGAAAVWNVLPAWLQGVIKGAVFVMKLTNPVLGAVAGAAVQAAEQGPKPSGQARAARGGGAPAAQAAVASQPRSSAQPATQAAVASQPRRNAAQATQAAVGSTARRPARAGGSPAVRPAVAAPRPAAQRVVVVRPTARAAAAPAARPIRASAAPAAVRPSTISRAQPAAAPARAEVGGRIDVHVSAEGRPTVRKVSTTNAAVPIDVYRGGVGGVA